MCPRIASIPGLCNTEIFDIVSESISEERFHDTNFNLNFHHAKVAISISISILGKKRLGPRIGFAQRMHARENACRPLSFTRFQFQSQFLKKCFYNFNLNFNTNYNGKHVSVFSQYWIFCNICGSISILLWYLLHRLWQSIEIILAFP